MTTPEHTPIEPEPDPGDLERYPFHIEGKLYLPLETSLPTDTCIRCSKPSVGTFSKALRNAKSPVSWYLPRPTAQIGLCKKHKEDRLVAHSLTYSMLAIGILLVIVGIVSFSLITILIGVASAGISGLFRARESIQGIDKGDDIYLITGACDSYVRQFPEHELVEE